MRILNCPQRSDDWYLARLGRLTASRASEMLAPSITKGKRKGKEAQARINLRNDLIVERLTGVVQESGPKSSSMQRGVELEPKAREAYEFLSGHTVTQVGFIQHDTLMAGCSPDGLIGGILGYEGGLEIKCPDSDTHLLYLRTGALPEEHAAQITHSLWVTGLLWWDFVSYDDRFKLERHRLFHIRVDRNEKAIAEYGRVAASFLQQVDLEVASLKGFSVLAEVQA